MRSSYRALRILSAALCGFSRAERVAENPLGLRLLRRKVCLPPRSEARWPEGQATGTYDAGSEEQ